MRLPEDYVQVDNRDAIWINERTAGVPKKGALHKTLPVDANDNRTRLYKFQKITLKKVERTFQEELWYYHVNATARDRQAYMVSGLICKKGVI